MAEPARPPVLVTGATGFAGGHLALRLRRLGYPVRALVRPRSARERLRAAGVELIEGDIRNRADVLRAAKGVAKIYHIAGVFRTAGHADSFYRNVNLHGTEHVLEAAQTHRVERTIHCSTIGVHGGVQEILSTEDSPFAPSDIYQETKLAGERAVRAALDAGLPGVIFRPAGIYGPGDLRLLKLFKTVHNRTFRMFGTGETLWHPIYIDDLVDGILLCGERPEALGQTYILAGDRYVTLNELVASIARVLGAAPPRSRLPIWPLLAGAAACETVCRPFGIDPPLHRRRAAFFIKNRAFSIEKARRELGYRPRVSLEEGLRQTAGWYVKHGHLAGAALVPKEERAARRRRKETGIAHASSA
jgi:dihydroflavonol-4-reductase